MRKNFSYPKGTIKRLQIDSQALKNNLLGDPTVRGVDVYIPHNHDGQSLPLLVDVVGFTGSGFGHTNWKNFDENVPERLDRLIAENQMPPIVCAFPDCFTRLGGNQYINSAAMGNWDDYLLTEMVPRVEADFSCGGSGKRGLFGKSSGGYGAITHALLHNDFWAAAACHSGDMGFELMFAADFPTTLRTLAKHGNSIENFMNALEKNPKPSNNDIHVLMTLAMAATYDPDPESYLGIRLPVTMDTCEYIAERWQNFMAWDPLTLLEKHYAGLKQLKGLYIDCGDIDQYNLVYGARRMHQRLIELDIAHEYQEFPDDHSSVDYRMDISLPFLAKALNA